MTNGDPETLKDLKYMDENANEEVVTVENLDKALINWMNAGSCSFEYRCKGGDCQGCGLSSWIEYFLNKREI